MRQHVGAATGGGDPVEQRQEEATRAQLQQPHEYICIMVESQLARVVDGGWHWAYLRGTNPLKTLQKVEIGHQ